MKKLVACLTLLTLFVAACGGNALVEITPLGDGGGDALVSRTDGKGDEKGDGSAARHDSGSSKGDSSTHADTGTPPEDTGIPDVTSPHDVTVPDTGTDTGIDTGTTPKDSGKDVGTSHDTGVDTGPVCSNGVACSSATTCTTPSNPCEVAICEQECCGIANASAGVACTSGNTHGVCNGNGECVACLQASDCTPPTCFTATCTQGTCVNVPAGSGTMCTGTNPDDKVCNGTGQCVECTNAGQCPTPPECMTAACGLGTCTTHPSQAETACAGGDVCDGTGNCVECDQGGDCPDAPVCQTATCTNHTCGTSDVAAGTNCGPDQPGTCDGHGSCTVIACTDPSTCPVPSNPCLDATCIHEGCSTGDAPQGTACTDPANMNAKVCDGTGRCVQCNTMMDCAANQFCILGACL
jgi:hypothetical protein